MDGAVSGQQALSSGLWASLCVGKTLPQELKDPSSCQAPALSAVKAACKPQNQVQAAQGSPTLHVLFLGP